MRINQFLYVCFVHTNNILTVESFFPLIVSLLSTLPLILMLNDKKNSVNVIYYFKIHPWLMNELLIICISMFNYNGKIK